MEVATALQYRYSGLAQEIICDSDAISGIRQSLDGLDVKRALVVCGPTILEKSNVVQRVQEALGGYCAGLFSDVAPHSPVEVVQRAVEAAGELNPDCLVSVGGGSTHDTCKGIAMMLAEGGDIHDYEMRFEPPDKVIMPHTPHEKVPIVSVPTTMGGAELSRGGGGFTDKALGRKILLSGVGNGHRVVIIDGQAIATTPLRIQMGTAIGQLRIAIETVYSTSHSPIGDALALHAIKLLVNYLPQWEDMDQTVLLNTKTAALLPMLAMASVRGLGMNTAIAHNIGGLYDVAHGEANAIMLPHTMRYNLDGSAERQVLIAEAMGIDTSGLSAEEAGLAASDGVAQLCRTLGLPPRLRDVGVPEEGLELLAAATLHDRGLATNPKPISDAGPIMQVLRDAW
jgi:alcohol dehydrogenase class IV